MKGKFLDREIRIHELRIYEDKSRIDFTIN